MIDFQNALSLILIVDKVRRAEDIKNLKKLPKNYIEEMANKIPEHFLKIFGDCVRLLLERANAPREEIETITEKIYERRLNNMFEFIDGYDIQATRKEARAEGKTEGRQEAIKEFEAKEKEYENEIKKLKEELNKYKMINGN